jgi:hypothetical protein
MNTTVEISEQNEKDIKLTRDGIKSEYGVLLPRKELPGFIEKVLDLYKWAQIEAEDISDSLTPEMAENYKKRYKDIYGKDLSTPEAFRQLRGVTAFSIYKEKTRLSNEMRSIIVKYKKVDYYPNILKKLKKLLVSYYGIKLSETDLKKVLRKISKFFWQTVDLNKSVDSCFDDMIKFKDRKDRGKSLAGLNNHKDIKEALETILHDLK